IHSVPEASRSINGREFICLYEKCINCSKTTKEITSILEDDMFAMVCGLYICSVCLNQFSVQTSQLVRTRITTRIQYPKPETFNRWKLKQQPETSVLSRVSIVICQNCCRVGETIQEKPSNSKALKTNRGGESIGFNTKPLIKPLQVGRRIKKVTLAVARREAMNFVFSLQSY
ncbi:LOW QUALITY PROTEIN: hypothetical protein HID58_086930, partial [Brassica napus]